MGPLLGGPSQMDVIDGTYAPENMLSGRYISFGASLLRLLSQGQVHISSANPFEAPDINPRYLSHPADIEVFARYVRALETLPVAGSMQPIVKLNGHRNHATAQLRDTNGAKEYVKRFAVSRKTSLCVTKTA